MSSPSNSFECRWQACGRLLAAYLLAQVLALGALYLLAVPVLITLLGVLACLAHALWTLARHIRLTHRSSVRGLRRNADGWQLWSAARGWHAVQLCPDSLALPLIVVLRYRLPGNGGYVRCAYPMLRRPPMPIGACGYA